MTALISPSDTQPRTAPASRPAKGSARRGFGTLFLTELKVWLRGTDILWVLFPAALLLINVFLGGDAMTEPAVGEEWAGTAVYGHAPITALIPVFVAMALAMTSVSILPVTFGGFRDKGVLKVFSASPMRPQALFGAHFLINGGLAVVGAGIAITAAAVMFPIGMPQNAAVVAVGLALGLTSMLAIGTLISAVVTKASQGTLFGNIAFFGMLIISGGLGPVPAEGSFLYHLMRVTPMGASVQVMNYGWLGSTASFGDPTTFPWIPLAAMVVWTLVLAPLAVKLFRWR